MSKQKVSTMKEQKKIIVFSYIQSIQRSKFDMLKNVSIIRYGQPINKEKDLIHDKKSEKCKYKLIRGGKKILYISRKNREGNMLSVPRVGVFNVKYIKTPFFVTNNAYSIECDNIITTKYLYYYFQAFPDDIKELYFGSRTNIDTERLGTFKIPIPNLNIQTQIVNSCEMCDNLQLMLQKEIIGLEKANKCMIENLEVPEL